MKNTHNTFNNHIYISISLFSILTNTSSSPIDVIKDKPFSARIKNHSAPLISDSRVLSHMSFQNTFKHTGPLRPPVTCHLASEAKPNPLLNNVSDNSGQTSTSIIDFADESQGTTGLKYRAWPLRSII